MSEKVNYYHNIIQGSDEWLQARLGVVTASEVSMLITPTGRLSSGKKVSTYANEIVAQQLSQQIEGTFQSFDMLRGHIQEGIARDIYSDNYAPVSECGFVTNEIDGVVLGCSPDGLVGDDGGIEIKSRIAKFQIETITSDEVPVEYMMQIQTNLLVTGRKWWDFVQYSNGMPLFVKRVYADAESQDLIVSATNAFNEKVKAILDLYLEKSKALIPTEYIEILVDEITESE